MQDDAAGMKNVFVQSGMCAVLLSESMFLNFFGRITDG